MREERRTNLDNPVYVDYMSNSFKGRGRNYQITGPDFSELKRDPSTRLKGLPWFTTIFLKETAKYKLVKF